MENVSHNTSYSECSPNVKDVDEEFTETDPLDSRPLLPPISEQHLFMHLEESGLGGEIEHKSGDDDLGSSSVGDGL